MSTYVAPGHALASAVDCSNSWQPSGVQYLCRTRHWPRSVARVLAFVAAARSQPQLFALCGLSRVKASANSLMPATSARPPPLGPRIWLRACSHLVPLSLCPQRLLLPCDGESERRASPCSAMTSITSRCVMTIPQHRQVLHGIVNEQ